VQILNKYTDADCCRLFIPSHPIYHTQRAQPFLCRTPRKAVGNLVVLFFIDVFKKVFKNYVPYEIVSGCLQKSSITRLTSSKIETVILTLENNCVWCRLSVI